MAVPLTLRVYRGDQPVAAQDYDRDIIKIGRLASAHLCLDDDKVSRIHSVIEVSPDGSLAIIDMGSVEGTFVNGKRVNKGSLQFGDEIKVGNTTIRVEKATHPAAVAPHAAPSAVASPLAPGGAPAGATPIAGQLQRSSYGQPRPQPPPAPPPTLRPAAPRAQARPVVQAPPQALPVAARPAPAASRATPRPARKASGPLGVQLRFSWGDRVVEEHYLPPGRARRFTVGSAKGVDVVMGEVAGASGRSFEVLRTTGKEVLLRFTAAMTGEWHRGAAGAQAEVVPLEQAQAEATPEGEAFALKLAGQDTAWVQLGSLRLDVFFEARPETVVVPWVEAVDFTLLNILLLCVALGGAFIITAVNREAEEAEGDDLNAGTARIAKLLIKPPEVEKNKMMERFYEKKKQPSASAGKRKGDEGQAGKREETKKTGRLASQGDPSKQEQAANIRNSVFGKGIASIFGSGGGLGGQLAASLGDLRGSGVGDSQGLGGLGLRGSGSGGGGAGDAIGVGGLGTRGRGSGQSGYGTGAGQLGGKASTDIGISASEAMVSGSLDKELIRAVIRANLDKFKYCYESNLIKYPKLEGKVSVAFTITPRGTVAQSRVANSTAGSPELEKCVAERVGLLQFPEPKGGGMVLVTYPFVFKASGK